MPTQKTSDWRERFDEMFGLCNGGDAVYAKIDDDGLSAKQYLKSFIESLLEEQREEIRAEIEKAVEPLAMAITHSVQGEYAKNEQFVKDILNLQSLELPLTASDKGVNDQ